MASAIIAASSASKSITARIYITGYRWWRIRLVLGALVMRFGAWIMGIGFEIMDKETS